MPFCSKCGANAEHARFCPSCGASLVAGAPAPAQQTKKGIGCFTGGLIAVGVVVVVIFALAIIASLTTQPSKERTVTLTQMELAAPCGQAEENENFYLAGQAGRGNDASGLLTMLADGRIYELDAGTQLDVTEGSRDIVVVYVKSGRLIGKAVCMRAAAIPPAISR
jgi:hypothetical protein